MNTKRYIPPLEQNMPGHCPGRQRDPQHLGLAGNMAATRLSGGTALPVAAPTPSRGRGRGRAHRASPRHALHHTQRVIILAGITSWVNRKRNWVCGELHRSWPAVIFVNHSSCGPQSFQTAFEKPEVSKTGTYATDMLWVQF